MKLITFAVPCYNSEAYMRHCIDLLLVAGEDAEIIIIDDGSADSTGRIADEYQSRNPATVRAIHQPNAGHGGAVNAGLRNASGLYFFVVDSDDWLDADALRAYMQLLRGFAAKDGCAVDLLISNYVYEKQGARHKKAVGYRDACPVGRAFAWDELRHFKLGEVFTMHSLTYRTQLLRDCGLTLPEHTFYVDNLVAYLPLRLVNTMYYSDINLYRYFIGRADQSVNLPVLIKRQEQHLLVVQRMIAEGGLSGIQNEKQRSYMLSFLELLMGVTSIIFIFDGGNAALARKDALWAYLRDNDAAAYARIRHGLIGRLGDSRSHLVMGVSKAVYRICRKIYGFN